MAGVSYLEEWESGSFSEARAVEIFSHEAILWPSIELGGFELSASEGLDQEPLFLLRRAHLRLLKHRINALLNFVLNEFRQNKCLLKN